MNSVVWPALYDGGFFPIGTAHSGRYLTIRRIYLASGVNKTYNLNEVKVYQVPNLFQALSTVTITPDTSPSTASDTAATNLITNLGNRGSTSDFPIMTVDKGLASYKSCFIVTETEIGSLDHIFKLGVDLGDSYMQHAILAV